jgi:hypothetical protein
MNFLFTAFGFIAYAIAAYELFESVAAPFAPQSELRFIACGVFCAWGTASIVGAYVVDILKAQKDSALASEKSPPSSAGAPRSDKQ